MRIVSILLGVGLSLCAAGVAQAAPANGRITFSGAVLAPTCSIQSTSLTTTREASAQRVTAWQACQSTARQDTRRATAFRSHVDPLANSPLLRNQLVRYYVAKWAKDPAQARLVTRTYR